MQTHNFLYDCQPDPAAFGGMRTVHLIKLVKNSRLAFSRNFFSRIKVKDMLVNSGFFGFWYYYITQVLSPCHKTLDAVERLL